MDSTAAVAKPIDIYEAMNNRLDESDKYIPKEQKQGFELQVAARLNELVGELIQRAETFVVLEKKKEFELHLAFALLVCIEDLSNDALARSNTDSAKIKDIWLDLRAKAEVTYRRLELQSPVSPERFRATLWWMAERGVDDDLDLLRQIRKCPRYPLPDILQLLADTEEKIAQKVEDPHYITRKGEEAYQKHKDLWDRVHKGKYIAIYHDDVVASHEDESKLTQEIIRQQKEKGPFRAYIVATGASPLSLRKPKQYFRGEGIRSEESKDEQTAGVDVQRLGWKTFRQDLPQLLGQYRGKWIAYHGQRRVALADSHTEIYDKIIKQGLPLNQMLVSCVEPLGPSLDLSRVRA